MPPRFENVGCFSDPSFEDVREGALVSYPCSPEIDDDDFRGIVLRAPSVVWFKPGDSNPINGSFAPVIVCGIAVFEYDTLGLGADLDEDIVFVAVDEARGETYRGTMVTVRNRVPPPSELDLDPDERAGEVMTSWFNPNLAAISAMPARPARYAIHAELGPFRSNVVSVSVELAEG